MVVPRVKICGITTVEDALTASALGADAIGLNFHEPSPRAVPPAAVEGILRALPPFLEAVGVFVNEPLREVFQTLNAFGRIHTVQWYGDKPELCDVFPFQWIPTFPVRDAACLRVITSYVELCRGLNKLPSAIAVDAHVPGQYGGTGRLVPWGLLADFQPGVPLILAGGLTPENVVEAIQIVQPYALDVASGVESSPGRKDAEKMRRFIDNARAASKT
jgi:phosphoribosylanthranilate isomerase